MSLVRGKFQNAKEEEDEDDSMDFDTGEASRTSHRIPETMEVRQSRVHLDKKLSKITNMKEQ